MKNKTTKRDQSILTHMNAIHRAANHPEKFKKALNAIRDDKKLKPAQRDAILRTLAQQSFQWYIEACSGKPVTIEQAKAYIKFPE